MSQDATKPAKQQLTLIDADVHNSQIKPQDLIKHLPAHYRERGITQVGHLGMPNPFGVNRADAQTINGGPPGSCVETMTRDLIDHYDMDYIVLTGAGILSLGVHPDPDYGAAIASAYNDWLEEFWLGADPRILGSIMVAPQDPKKAAAEIRKRAGHAKLKQVIMTSATDKGLGDRFYWPIYEAAVENGLPVAVHPGQECTGTSNPFTTGYPQSYFEWHNNLSQNYMAQVSSLVARGAFCEFPTLKFVAIEGGIGWLPHLMWRMDKNWKALRVTVPWLEKAPSEYVVEHVRLTTQPVEEPENPQDLVDIFRMAHAEKTVMFSSDYPHWDFDDPFHAFPKMPQEMKDAIFWKNAKELYNLPDEPPHIPANA